MFVTSEIMEDFVTKLIAARTAVTQEPLIPHLLPNDSHLSGYYAVKEMSIVELTLKSQIVSDDLFMQV
jgi:hypothetical protein